MTARSVHAEPIQNPMRDDDVVARVNGTPIYRRSVREVVQGILAAQDRPPDPASIGKLADEALDSLVALELLYQQSQAAGITIDDTTVTAEIARSKSRFPDAAAFSAALKAKGMSESDLRRETRKTLAVNRLLETGAWKDVHISADQVKAFYEHNREAFKHPAETRISQILVRIPAQASATERDRARAEAAHLLEQLKGGADFAQLARTSSQDPASAAQGGDVGFISKGDMPDAVERAAFTLAPGQLSDVIVSPYGFHIIKVTDRRSAGYEPLNEVHDRISEVLLKEAHEQRQAALVDQLRRNAKVEFLDPAAR